MDDSARRDSRELSVARQLVAEVEKVVIGKHTEVMLLVTALLSGGHVLIEDVPGVGKTTMAAALARVAGLTFRSTQFTPDVMASDITGFNVYNRSTERFEFRQGLAMCHILLADEINRASPKTQSSLLEAMEENRVTVDGVTYPLPQPFMVIATQNPAGYVGTYPLPEAQLDRFALRLSMGYPTTEEELSILADRRGSDPADALSAVASPADIAAVRQACAGVRVSDEVSAYIVKLVQATRKSHALSLGASPRASLALMRLSRAYAFLRGRDYVLPEDVAALYVPAVAHRVALSQESRMNRISAESVLREILGAAEVPYRTGREGRK